VFGTDENSVKISEIAQINQNYFLYKHAVEIMKTKGLTYKRMETMVMTCFIICYQVKLILYAYATPPGGEALDMAPIHLRIV